MVIPLLVFVELLNPRDLGDVYWNLILAGN